MYNEYVTKVITGVDANVLNAVTASLDLFSLKNVSFGVSDESGTHATHVITLQYSADDTNWFDSSHTITGEGMVDDITTNFQYVRAEVTTAEGAASVVTVGISAKG